MTNRRGTGSVDNIKRYKRKNPLAADLCISLMAGEFRMEAKEIALSHPRRSGRPTKMAAKMSI
eukprot:scaffold13165_cov177-Amphora_coffeaeformis.AAC.6